MARRSRRAVLDDSDEEDAEGIAASPAENENDDDMESLGASQDDGDFPTMMFSSQAPDPSQDIRQAKDTAKAALLGLDSEVREKHIADLTRLCLFRALSGRPIPRGECSQHLPGLNGRTIDAVFEQVNVRLINMFGFELRVVPKYMQSMKYLPKKHKDRYYALNRLHEDDDEDEDERMGGTQAREDHDARAAVHDKQINSVHLDNAIEKSLLMVILALAYCKGEPLSDGSRWILDQDLYDLLHHLDENIPATPPGPSQQARRPKGNNGSTPNVDVLLSRLVDLDYLLRVKAGTDKHWLDLHSLAEETSFFYSMGPRAAIEVGRRQVIYFCAEILDEAEPDPTMLAEIQETQDDDEEVGAVN